MKTRALFNYVKKDGFEFISNLDMNEHFKRAVRVSRFPVEYSKGFNPQPGISVAYPPPTGVIINGEPVVMTLSAEGINDLDFYVNAFNEALPEGIKLLNDRKILYNKPVFNFKYIEYFIFFDREIDAICLSREISCPDFLKFTVKQKEKNFSAGKIQIENLKLKDKLKITVYPEREAVFINPFLILRKSGLINSLKTIERKLVWELK